MQKNTSENLDINAVLSAAVLPLFLWSFLVVGVTVFGYPGVVCITPVAWMLALTVGQTCIHCSTSKTKKTRIREAGFAGGILGAGQGLMFTVINLIGIDLAPGEIPRTVLIGVIITTAGTFICAIIGVAFANYIETKQQQLTEKNLESNLNE